MTETSIPMLVSSLAVPMTISQLITVIYNTADTYFVSELGKSTTASVGVVFSIMSIIQAFGYSIGIGASSIISRKLGEENKDYADTIASSAFFFAVVMGFIIMAVGLSFSESIVMVLGATETMAAYATDYAKYIFIVAPVMCGTFVLNMLLRSEGDATLAMIGLCSGGLLNVFLDPILIFKCNMGVGGAAAATAISQIVSFLILGSMFARGKSIVKIRLRRISRSFKDYVLIVTTGLPTLCRQGLASVASALINIQAKIYGDAAIAAITIGYKVYLMIRHIILGIGQGFQPVAGYNYGAKKYRRVKSAFWFSVLLGSVVCVTAAVLMLGIPERIINWFIDDEEVIRLGAISLKFGCYVMPVMAYSTYVNQLYQCLGFRKEATFLATCRQGVMFIPLVFLLPAILGLTGVQLAQPMADGLTFVISVPFQIKFIKMLNAKITEPENVIS